MESVFNSEKLNLSTKEKKRLYECLRKKEFHDLLHDYMKDLQDPKTRMEQEMYIRQLEGNNQLPAGLKILRPKPEFCVKTKIIDESKSGKSKHQDTIFINICSSDHVQEASPQTVEQNGMMGTSWSIPYSMGPKPRSCLENKESVMVYDAIFSSKSMASFTNDVCLRDLMIKTGMEGVARIVEEKLEPNYEIVKGVKCKGGDPPSLSLRDDQVAAEAAKLPNKNHDPLIPAYDADSPPRNGPKNLTPSTTTTTTTMRIDTDTKDSMAQ
mmetsp:Transcript_5887/g.10811  ORF Transcript_5887/g.10811 Transcript_5887/m.10811 type:complete len:268 (+) Transcript_5887:130-933(+)